MNDPEFVEWMNMEIDGVLPSRDRAKLHRYLESNPEAAKQYESLCSVVASIDKSVDSDPPIRLEERILAAVPFDRYPTASAGSRLGAGLERWFFTLRLRYAAVFVFGIVFGLLVYSAISYDSGRNAGGLDTSDFWGTMRQITDVDGFEQTQELGVDLDQVRGRVSLHEHDEILLADISLETPSEIEWVLEYDTGAVSFEGYRSFNGSSGNVVAGSTEMRVLQSGDAHYLLFFTQKNHPIKPLVVKIYSADQLLFERALTPAANKQ